MNTDLVFPKSLETEELRKKQAELAALQSDLTDRELYLVDLQVHLTAFEGRYLRQVGTLYAELDEWDAQVAKVLADEEGTQETVSAATGAHSRAQDSYAATHGEASHAKDLDPSPELRGLFREVAKRIHPDFAIDEADRSKRGQLMAEANAAFQRGDAATLKDVLDKYENSPEAVKRVGVAADLLRITRQITQILHRLAEIEALLAELTSSEMAKLMAKVQTAKEGGRDLLEEMASDVRERILTAKNRYNNRSQGAGVQ